VAKTKNKKQKKAQSTGNKPSKFIYWIIGIVVVCIAGLVILANLPEKGFDFDYENQPVLGEESASVSIVEFGDYRCPVCKNFNESFFPVVKENLIDTGKAKFYYMNYPFIHADSTTSALFAETVYSELGNDIFWKFHDSIFANQPDNETEETYTEEFLKERLKDAGATDEDITKVTEAFQKQTAKDSLQKDLDYVNQLNITGTPTIYVNGVKFEGSSYNELLDMVNEAAEK